MCQHLHQVVQQVTMEIFGFNENHKGLEYNGLCG